MKGFQRGSLMIEVMVSSLIGTLLLYGALSIMLNSRVSYLAREGLSRIEERGRLALEILANDIRMSGYRGCVLNGDLPMVRAIDNSPNWMQPELGIRGWEYSDTEYSQDQDLYTFGNSYLNNASWVPSTGQSLKGLTNGVDILKGSDVVELWVAQPYVMDVLSALSGQLNVNTATMNGTPSGSDDEDERLLLVSDCTRNILVKADSFDTDTGVVLFDSVNTNSSSNQLTSMTASQAVMIKGALYYLALPSHSDRPSLYRKEINADGSFNGSGAVEVLPGVINFQLMYGENIDSELSADRYVMAEDVSDWSEVISVRIYMLVETESERVAPEGQDFYYFGRTYSPENNKDKRIRREYTTTVTLRNRALGLAVVGEDEVVAPPSPPPPAMPGP